MLAFLVLFSRVYISSALGKPVNSGSPSTSRVVPLLALDQVVSPASMLLPTPALSVESYPSLRAGFETRSPSIVLVGFKLLAILLPQPPKSWDRSMGQHTQLSKALYSVVSSTGICLALLPKCSRIFCYQNIFLATLRSTCFLFNPSTPSFTQRTSVGKPPASTSLCVFRKWIAMVCFRKQGPSLARAPSVTSLDFPRVGLLAVRPVSRLPHFLAL